MASSNNNDDDEEFGFDDTDDGRAQTSSEAAGVVRGISRSIKGAARSIVRFPAVGRLPRQVVKQRRLPVRRVAKLSDRLSTGLDLLQEAAAGASGEGRKPWRMRFKNFISCEYFKRM